MNWLKKLFQSGATQGSLSEELRAGELAQEVFPPRADEGAPFSPSQASRVATQNFREHCDRLEREANRTGNPRLLQQARNIRARLS